MPSMPAPSAISAAAARSRRRARPYTTTVAGKSVAIIGIDGVTANVEAREPDATVNEAWLGGAKYAGATNDTPGTYPYDPDIFLPDIESLGWPVRHRHPVLPLRPRIR